MNQALDVARVALANQEVPVGCIFIYNQQVIATGSNEVNETKNATRHAELICIDQVLRYCRDKQLEADTVFAAIQVVVTVEPCIMCAAALVELDVSEIIFGCINDRFGGTTVCDVFGLLQSKCRVTGGVRADEAMALLKEFYKGQNPSAPPHKKRKTEGINESSL